MKISKWLSLTALVAASALAQPTPAPTVPTIVTLPASLPPVTIVNTNIVAPPKTNAPAKPLIKKKVVKAAPKKIAAKPGAPAVKKADAASTIKSEPLIAGPATVVASNVNVRGQAKLNSEVVTKLTKGDAVTVLEEVTLKNSKADEPSAWAKIILPAKAHAWVNTSFISTNKTVSPKKLNLRTGPGENYSVIGTLVKGDAVKEVSAKDGWTQIEAPATAFAFVAAAYLKNEAPTIPAGAPTPVEPTLPPLVTEAVETNTIVPPGEVTVVATNATPVAEATTPPVAPPVAPVVKDEPPPKRIVEREGIVHSTVSIQAPTHYELVSPETGKPIDYLYTSSHYLDLSRYKGLRIIVTGEEGLDDRWPTVPVITIQKIQVLE